MMQDTRPLMYDLFCKAGGTTRGYQQAGFRVIGVDIEAQPHHCGDGFIQMDWLEFMQRYMAGEFEPAQAFHASPPCQGYSIMNNLPWLKNRDYPLLLLPVRLTLERIGLPYVLENVMGARHGSKGLTKRGLEAHGLEAGWLCGTMFGLPFYRHRLFAANWLWLAPGHPKHTMNLHPRSERYVYGGTVKGLPGGAAGLDVKPKDPFHDKDGKSIMGPGHLGKGQGIRLAAKRGGTLPHSYTDGNRVMALQDWQNGAQAAGVGVGHAKGWRLAAEAMGIDWMKRAELTQAIPPAYTFHVGTQLRRRLEAA
jgi:DNA (cytosine-5)-methyltransferase 1